ncbi:MAG: flagellar basal body P-ring protein FlgI [Planctomycetota bacterium]|jgi:flagellar P-ring protein precursor FlgI
MKRYLIPLLVALLGFAQISNCERIKDIVDIQGIRSNPLRGIGLVVGLDGTGDSTVPSQQILTSILRESGIVVSPLQLSGNNIAIVMVTAELGPFARQGSQIDVDVSSISDAKSLQGGMLLPTPLYGLDEQVYAVAQGGISIGGWTISGDNASISKNHQTVGRIPNGAVVEKAEIANFTEIIGDNQYVTLNLRNSDFSTAQRISDAINMIVRQGAQVLDAGTIRVQIPDEIHESQIVAFIDDITRLEVKVDVAAVVVVNEKTGTIVVGEHVGISTVAISQGSLVVQVKESAFVSQPIAPFSDAGTTEVVPDTMVGVEETPAYLIPVERSVTVSELASSLNAIGATPRDIIAIFNTLKQAGALQARLEIM